MESEQAREKRHAYARKYSKEQREERKAHGICTMCGVRDARPGRTKCEICALKADMLNERYRHQREAQHKCITCGHPLPENETRRYCEACTKRQRSRFKMLRERSKNGGKL